jgi:PAS domain S-box-containing protein
VDKVAGPAVLGGLGRYVLFLLALMAWIGSGAFLLAELNAHARAALSATTQARASIAAARLDRRLSALLHAPDLMKPAAAHDSHSKSSGIEFRARNAALEVISSVERTASKSTASGSAGLQLDKQAFSAAKETLATGTPHVSAVHAAVGGPQGGIDIWLPSSAKGGNQPTLLQAYVPVAFLNDTLSEFSGGPWIMAVTDSNGGVLTSLHTIDDAATAQGVGSDDSYLERISDTSALGLRVRAAASLAPLRYANQRNWICFALVTSLMVAATMMFASPLSRAAQKENDDLPEEKRRRANDAMVATARRTNSEANHLTPSDHNALHPSAPEQKNEGIEQRLRLALEAAGMCAWEWSRDSGSIIWNASCEQILKPPASSAAITARDVLRRIFPHERRRLLNMVRASLSQGRPLTADIRLRRFDGEFCWMSLRAQPVMNKSGQVIGIAGIAQDITDQKQSLSRTDSLLREVSHRSKNMLALILAMARLTAREAVDVQSHLKEFALRVAGLAASQDLIVAADWQSVDFSTLASAEIEAVARSDAMRVKISGPDLLVTPEAAQTLGMILTELALNAVKHGALSVATGKVRLSWALEDSQTITISWREIGGPEYDPERAAGYGTSVIERFSTQGLKLESGASCGPDGFTWTVSGPLANIGTVSPRARRDGRA